MELKHLKTKRKLTRAEITRIANNVESNLPSLSREEKMQTLVRLRTLQESVREQDQNILDALCAEDSAENVLESEYEMCAEYARKITASIIELETALKPESNLLLGPTAQEPGRSQLKLPQIPFPEYSHKEGEDLNKFLVNFETIVAKYNLSSYEKFIFLQRQLKGAPHVLIQSLEIREQNYEAAKALLQKAFANPVIQKFEVIKRLTEMKLARNGDPYYYIGQMRSVVESFRTLSIDADVILQYFFWQGLNEEFQQQLIHITNKNKPSLDELMDHIYEATERCLSAKSHAKPTKNSSSNFAVGVGRTEKGEREKQRPHCSLCTGKGTPVYSHSSFNCPTYPNPKAKRDRLISLNGCTKCANLSHGEKACRFQFKKGCYHCSGSHYTFLCAKGAKEDPSPKASREARTELRGKGVKEVGSGVVAVSRALMSMTVDYGQDVIIPTFSIRTPHGRLRCMRDSGCQPNFITNELAANWALPVLDDDFLLTVNGFNTSQDYRTRIVAIQFDESQPPLRAICVPEIRTSITLPGLSKLAHAIQEKGYALADATLVDSRDQISGIDFMLGNLDSQILPQQDLRFGDAPQSVISLSPLGVLLSGSVKRMLGNLHYLAPASAEAAYSSNANCSHAAASAESVLNEIEKTDDARANDERTQEGASGCEPHGLLEGREPPVNKEFREEACLQEVDCVIDSADIEESVLDRAIEDMLRAEKFKRLAYETGHYEDQSVEQDEAHAELILSNCSRASDGRLVMPLLWNKEVCHDLGTNFNLSKQILKSNLRKLQKKPEYLAMYDKVITDQVKEGMIEPVEDLNLVHDRQNSWSFLPHMGVFRPEKESTKCRVVFLSNICEKRPQTQRTLTHNQAMHSGPNLNNKLATAFILLRFDKYLLTFDIKKAFLNIALSEEDQIKLMFLWYRDPVNADFSLVAYKHLRLAFGLKCSPAILMLALFKILVLDATSDEEDIRRLKNLVYCLTYMDNASITSNDPRYLSWAYFKLPEIFNKYQFSLQQFLTNDPSLQERIDSENAIRGETGEEVRLFGLKWDRITDEVYAPRMELDASANSKRKVMSTIASNYDLFQISGPVLNRARLFAHKLQCDNQRGWDECLPASLLQEWRNICKQVNKGGEIKIPRFVGDRDDKYRLIAFTDASKVMYGVVVFIQSLTTGKSNFLLAKNRLVNKQLEDKSVPSLEFHAIALGTQALIDLYSDLTCERLPCPLNIEKLSLFSDSLVSLSWLTAYATKLDKMQKLTAFVKNRLHKICKLCEVFPVEFAYVAGADNPADCITRSLSYKQLAGSHYHTGPKFLSEARQTEAGEDNLLSFTVPSHKAQEARGFRSTEHMSAQIRCLASDEQLIPLERYSSFYRLARVYRIVLKFVRNLRNKKLNKKTATDESTSSLVLPGHNAFGEACRRIVIADQRKHFPDCYHYLQSNAKTKKDTPALILQLNLNLDSSGLLRVNSKFERWSKHSTYGRPILLAKNSKLTELIVNDVHTRMNHAGLYSTLTELRRQYFIPSVFSVAKKILRKCVTCRRSNERSIKLNQSSYRDFRVDPPAVPFRHCFIDHIGPFYVRTAGTKVKVWILCITCLWSRAINLKLSLDLSVKEFLRAFQKHVFEFGLPHLVLSDSGSQLIAGSKIISKVLQDPEVEAYCEASDIKITSFQQYPRGCSALGSLVESCVKLIKRLLFGSIGNNVLDLPDFDLAVAQVTCLVNKRPVAFKETLRDSSISLPSPITPEALLRGYVLHSPLVLPHVSEAPDDPEWVPSMEAADLVRENFAKLNAVRRKLVDKYNSQFIPSLITQATSKKDGFRPVKHKVLGVNDLVLLKEPNQKRYNYAMGRVTEVTLNHLGEVTEVSVLKGNGGTVRRHVTSLIPLLTASPTTETRSPVPPNQPIVMETEANRPRRLAAQRGRGKIKDLIERNLI